jgi:peptidoglycan hydrolase-like protein with peptidoglycan-binding domain
MTVRRFAPTALALVSLALLPSAAEAAKFGSRTLRQGSHGSDVKTLQRYLGKVGQRTSVDGQFGRGTKRSVKRFEKASHRRSDGVVTRSDARVLKREAKTAQVQQPAPVAGQATLTSDGLGNKIAKKPYKYGGGHGKFNDTGYDCSGSVSYALHAAGLLDTPMDSTELESFGSKGRGQWVTIRANSGHAYMVVAGLRFDTSGASSRDGSRWTDEMRSARGYVGRHPDGL